MSGWLSNWLDRRLERHMETAERVEEAFEELEHEIATTGRSFHEIELSKIKNAIASRASARATVAQALEDTKGDCIFRIPRNPRITVGYRCFGSESG